MSALAIAFVLISALCHAVRSLFTKESGDKQIFLWLYSIFALLFFSPLFFYFLYRVGITQPVAYAWCFGSGFIHLLCGMCYYTPYILLSKNAEMIKQEWNSGLSRIIASGVIGIFGYMLILVAFTIECVSYIVGLRQTSIVFAVLMGSHFLNEKHQRIRLTGSLIILAGGFLISLAK